jgi:hypothetical protein
MTQSLIPLSQRHSLTHSDSRRPPRTEPHLIPSLTGRSREQVDEFLAQIVAPIRARYGTQDIAEYVRV